jgi:hypothetical protein
MKRRIAFSIALGLSIVGVALLSSDSTVGAQNQMRLVGDTGIVMLGPNQTLRVAATPGDVDGADFLVFRRMEYAQNGCNAGACKYSVASQTTSPTMTLLPGEARFMDTTFDDQSTVRVLALSNSRKLRVSVQIIDRATGEVNAFYNALVYNE